jgi:hypothetical protein
MMDHLVQLSAFVYSFLLFHASFLETRLIDLDAIDGKNGRPQRPSRE